MKYLICFFLLSGFAFADGVNKDFKKASKKVEKRKGYCSPLDKMMKKCAAAEHDTDKKIVVKAHKKTKEISKKVEKRKDYCSPLDKMMKKCGNKKK